MNVLQTVCEENGRVSGFFRYLVIGGVGFCYSFGVFWLVFQTLGDQIGAGLSTLVAGGSWLPVGYFLQARLTFRSQTSFRGFLRYFSAQAFSMVCNPVLVWMLVEINGLDPYVSFGSVVLLLTALTFFLSRIWVFKT